VGVEGVGRRIEGQIALMVGGVELWDIWVGFWIMSVPSFGGVGMKSADA